MFWELLANLSITLRNHMSKEISADIDVVPLTIVVFLTYGLVATACFPFYRKKLERVNAHVWKKMILYSVLSLITSFLIAVCFDRTDSVPTTAALMTLNILFSFLLESFIAGRIVAKPKKIIGMTAIIGGVMLATL